MGSWRSGDKSSVRRKYRLGKNGFKIASKLQEHAAQSERWKRPRVSDFTNIPTEDPRAALQFCQSLAHMLAVGSNPAINNTRQRQIAGGINAVASISEHQPEVFVVITVFNKEGKSTVLHSRLAAVLEDAQIIMSHFRDDGSDDDSLDQLVPTSTFQIGRPCPLPKTVLRRFALIAKVITFRAFTNIGSRR